MLRHLRISKSKVIHLGFLAGLLLLFITALLLSAADHVTAQKSPTRRPAATKKSGQNRVPQTTPKKPTPKNRQPVVVAREDSTQCPTTPPTDPAQCGGGPCVVEIRATDRDPREKLKENMSRDNVTVLLAPDLDLDFTGLPDDWFPIKFGRCSTLQSVSSFGAEVSSNSGVRRQVMTTHSIAAGAAPIGGTTGPLGGLEVEQPAHIGSARTPKSPGPVLRYGTNHPRNPGTAPYQTFMQVMCTDDDLNDGVRISGFRLYGPSFGQQETSEVGIRINYCVDVEVSNMEIAGWGEAGIRIDDNDPILDIPEGCVKLPNPSGHPRPLSQAYSCPPGKEVTRVPYPGPGGRLSRPDQIRIFGNYIHHNQHPTTEDGAAGYGVNVGYGAWAQISENVFDFNRHAIKGGADSGGYIARRNLVLKGGGYHGSIVHTYTHQFDVHGDQNCGIQSLSDSAWNCGHGGVGMGYEANSIQYTNNHGIKLRGKPRTLAYFSDNVFPHDSVVDSPLINGTDGGIALYTGVNVEIRPGNVPKTDSFAHYSVCDFDGDGLDDLFLATGATWWYSSMGRYPWSYMGAKKEKWDQIKVGYFDNDLRCDVVMEHNGQWLISSGGYGDWQNYGQFDAKLSDIQFGRFERSPSDPAGVRRTPHVFRRAADGQWSIAALYSYKPGDPVTWKEVKSSHKTMDQLRFGDFDGDGITDVLAVDGGRWSISSGAAQSWRHWNQYLSDKMSAVLIANMDSDDNIPDVLRLERKSKLHPPFEEIEFIWWRSKDGKDTWKKWDTVKYVSTSEPGWTPPLKLPTQALAGHFDSERGFALLFIDPVRIGKFYSQSGHWSSEFAY